MYWSMSGHFMHRFSISRHMCSLAWVSWNCFLNSNMMFVHTYRNVFGVEAIQPCALVSGPFVDVWAFDPGESEGSASDPGLEAWCYGVALSALFRRPNSLFPLSQPFRCQVI